MDPAARPGSRTGRRDAGDAGQTAQGSGSAGEPPDRPTPSPRRRLIGRVLLAAGLVLIAGAVTLVVVDQRPSIAHELGLTDEEVPYPSKLRPSASPGRSTMPRKNRVVIPGIGLDAVVHQGEGTEALDLGVWHQPNGASPPTNGNTVLAGHRIEGVFLLLPKLKPGDEIIVYWKQQEYDYRVVRVIDTDPDDEDVLRCGSTRGLTLYTCVPRYEGDKRTVVVAEPI